MNRLHKVLAFSLTLPTAMLSQQKPVTVRYAANGTPEQVMDVYWPSTRATATILFIHGGSLQESGERRTSAMYQSVCAQFVMHGVACATMDYRLAPAHSWPAMPEDVASAIASLRKLIANRKGDPARFFLLGHSSGCHLAAIVGTDSSYLRAVGLSTRDIAGIIPMGCTLDRDDATLRGLTPERIRKSFMSDAQDLATYGTPENYLAANPASHLGSHVPPTLIVVADAERFMPPVMEQGARVVRILLENNVPANLVVVPGTHESSIAGLGKDSDPALSAILRFIANPKGTGAAH